MFNDWVIVGRALHLGRQYAMQAANTNRPFGRKYTRAMADWLAEHQLDQIPQQERYSALRLISNLDAITAWRNSLPAEEQRRINHPDCYWRGKRSTRPCSSAWRSEQDRRRREHRLGEQLLQHGISQAMLAMASHAVYDCLIRGCTDAMVIARSALMAATREPKARRDRQRQHTGEAAHVAT